MPTVRRYDRGEYRQPSRTPQGYLRADAYLTRVGVFDYRQPDGTVRRELRPPEEVFAPESLASFSLAPLTLLHPQDPLTPENTRLHQVGTVGESPAREDAFVRASVVIQDAAAIRAVESGDVQELSCGYSCELEPTAGEWQGQRYDGVQRQIRGNHVALVPRGRAGPEVRLHLDAADAEQVGRTDEAGKPSADSTGNPNTPKPPDGGNNPTGGSMSTKIRIDGVTYEVSEQAAEALARADEKHSAAIAERDSKIASLTADVAKARTDGAEQVKAAKAEADKEKARADALQSDLDKEKKARADAAAAMPALVKARVELESKARAILGAEAKLDGLDEAGIKKAVVAKLAPEAKLDGASEAYVQARYDIALEEATKAQSAGRNPSLEKARADAEAARTTSTRVDSEAARQRMIEANRKAALEPAK